MDKSFKRRTLMMVLASGISFLVDAQEKGQGEIESVQYEIVVEKKITLPPVNRNFEKVPPRPIEPVKPEIIYNFTNLNFKASDFNPVVRPLRLQNEALGKLYPNYISGGFGNFASPYLSAYITSKRDREKFGALSVYHRSFGRGPVDDSFSGSGTSQIRLSGNSFGKSVTVGGSAEFENNSSYFYGYQVKPAERTSLRQTYNSLKFSGELTNSKTSEFNYQLSGGFRFLADHFDAKETEVITSLTSSYDLDKKSKMTVNADYSLLARKDILRDAKPRHLLRTTIGYQWSPIDDFNLMVGANVAYENDSLGKENKSLHVYPNVQAQYNLSPKIRAYASLSGNMEKVSLQTLSTENIWIQPNIDIFHTNKLSEFLAGLKASVGTKAFIEAGFSVASLQGFYFFQNTQTDVSKFATVYDRDNTTRANVFTELNIAHATKFKWMLRADYFKYSTNVVNEVRRSSSFSAANLSETGVALHRPNFKLTSSLNYNLYDKLLFNVRFIAQGGMKAIDFSQSNATSLKVVSIKNALDLGIGADYLVSRQFSVFARVDNLLSNEYELYHRYPVRGFQALVGISWSF